MEMSIRKCVWYMERLERRTHQTIEGIIQERRLQETSPLVGEVASNARRWGGRTKTMSDPDLNSNPMVERARQLRKEMTDVEKKLWYRLRPSQLGVRFRRQCPIGPYIADFACHAPKLIIELTAASTQSQNGRRTTSDGRSGCKAKDSR
jgi:hypothetical protein